MEDQARGGARPSTEDQTTQRTGPGPSRTTGSIAIEHGTVTLTNTGVTAAAGDVRLTIRSSKSALSESPLGPSASIGIAWAIGSTQAHSNTVRATSSLARIVGPTPACTELGRSVRLYATGHSIRPRISRLC